VRTLLTLAIVLTTLNGVGRVGHAYLKYYQFRDAATERLRFSARTPTATLHEQMMEKAGKLEIPIQWDQLVATRDGTVTVIEASYVQAVELLPIYSYPITFQFQVEESFEGDLDSGVR
jgi:hypothetical protein